MLQADRWHALSPHLDRALELTAEQRVAWLDALRAQDNTLAADLERLLEDARDLSRERFGKDDWRTGEATLALGQCLLASGQRTRAEALIREADTTLQAHRRDQPRLALQAAHARAQLSGSSPGFRRYG
jgi:hypothetical protein